MTVAARGLMRLVAVAAGHRGEFSWSGSLGIVMIFTMAMVPGALLAAVTTARWRWVLLAAGALLLLVPATGIASDEIGSISRVSSADRIGLLAASVGVYLCIGVLPVVTLRLVDRWRRADERCGND